MSYSFSVTPLGESYIEELNKTDFSNMKSEEFFRDHMNYVLLPENTLYLIVGSDSGLLLPYLLRQPLGSGSRIAVIEHDDVYPLIADRYASLLSKPPENIRTREWRLTLHKASVWHEQVSGNNDYPCLFSDNVQILHSRASTADYYRIYTPLLHQIRTVVQERLAEMSAGISQKTLTRMQLRNAADNITPLKLSNIFGAGKTAIILGDGLSLDKHLEWVKINREKLFILAVSNISAKLIKHDLKPDLSVSTDSQDMSYESGKAGLNWTDVPLIYHYHVCALLLQQWQGPSYRLGKRLPWHDGTDSQCNVPFMGPTASHAAAFVALNLGFSTVLIAGADLCHSRIADTDAMFKNGNATLKNIGAMPKEFQARLFNLNCEAASCSSAPCVSIDDVELIQLRPDFETHMQASARTVSIPELDELTEELELASAGFREIRSLCAKAKTCIAQIRLNHPGLEATKSTENLKGIQIQLQESYPRYLAAIVRENNIEFSRTTSPALCRHMDPLDLASRAENYYNLIDEGANTLVSLIVELGERIEIRRHEHDNDPDVRQLAMRWRQDETPGRILLWKRLNWQRVRPKDRAWVQRTIGKFRSTLRASDTSTAKEVVQENVCTGTEPVVSPATDEASIYGQKVSGALDAIMGARSDQAA